MDFWYSFQLQKETLKSPEIPNLINEDGKIQIDCKVLKEFQNHLIVSPEEFWQIAINNILEHKRSSTFELDDSLLQYILILISWYTDEDISNPDSSSNLGNSSLLASQFYLRLLNLIEFKYFKSVIYENCFHCLNKYYEGHERNVNCLNFMKSLKQLLISKELEKKYLKFTLSQLCDIIDKTSNKVYTDFSIEHSLHFTHEAFLCLKCLANQNWPTKIHFIINYALLHGVRSRSGSEIMKKNFRNLVVDLTYILKKDNYKKFQNVFLYIVSKTNSVDAMEASKIMLALDEYFFKDTICKLTIMGVSKEVSDKTNILRLLGNLLEQLPTNYYEPPKLEIFIQTVLNMLVMNCINNDEALLLVSKICLLNKDIINKQFKILLNTPTEYIYVENSLPTFFMKFNLHWSNRLRNRNIVVIILRIMSITLNNASDEHYAGILAMISNEADPSDLKMCIPILLNLYITSKAENFNCVADKILEVMYSMAVHRSTGSTEFLKTLFQLIVEPTEDISEFKEDFITALSTQILADNKAFIAKAYEMKLCETHVIKKLIKTIMGGDYDILQITCAVVEKSPSPQGEKLIYHIMANPALLSEVKYTGNLLFIIHSGITYFVRSSTNITLTPTQHDNLRQFTKLLWEHIMKLNLPFNALGVANDVLKALAELRREPFSLDTLFQTVNFELKTALMKIPNEAYTVPIMYSAELLTNKAYDIPDDTIQILLDALDRIVTSPNPPANSQIAAFNARYYCCLVLIVRLSMKHSRLGSKAMDCIKDALRTTDQDFRMSVMDLMYDLCTYVVHNFDDFLYYSFNDLKSLNILSRKQAATHIEHFVRLDYLKLSVEQYCKFISLLGDPVTEKSMQKLITNFILSNQAVIEKYFLALIMHVNFYSVHPMCRMSPQYMQDMNCIIRANFNKWKLYSTLFRSLPLRSRFLTLKEICSSFFDKFIFGEMKIEDGIWHVMTDAISLFKIMAYNSLDNLNYEEFYEKQMGEIKKYFIDKKNISSEIPLKCPEMRDATEKITYTLLHLLFYTENEVILQKYKFKLFEAILFWTHDLLPDIGAVCNSSKENTPLKISNYYLKLHHFYTNHKQCLDMTEYISEYNESNTFNLS